MRSRHGPATPYTHQASRGDPWAACEVCGTHVQSSMTSCGACGKKVCPDHKSMSLWASQWICTSCFCAEIALALEGDDGALSQLNGWFSRFNKKMARKKSPSQITGVLG